MALVESGYSLNVSLVDNGANVTVKTFDLDAADMAEATTQTATVLAEIAKVSDAVVKGYSIAQRFVEDALVLPAGGVQIENQASIVASLYGNPSKFVALYIPAPKSTIFVAQSGKAANTVDITDPDVISYAGLFANTGGIAYISDGERIGALIGGKRIHRGSRKG